MRPLSRRRPITGRLGTRHLSNTPFQIRTYLINLKQRENCARFVIFHIQQIRPENHKRQMYIGSNSR